MLPNSAREMTVKLNFFQELATTPTLRPVISATLYSMEVPRSSRLLRRSPFNLLAATLPTPWSQSERIVQPFQALDMFLALRLG
jgi:hypothetical protein